MKSFNQLIFYFFNKPPDAQFGKVLIPEVYIVVY